MRGANPGWLIYLRVYVSLPVMVCQNRIGERVRGTKVARFLFHLDGS